MQDPPTVTVDFARTLGPMDMGNMALGQGGLSPEPMWGDRTVEVRALGPRLIRFWAQEYFHPMRAPGRFSFDTVERAIDPVLRTGATPLVTINFKPDVLFPVVDESNLTPSDWSAWEDLVFRFVRHFADRGQTGWYWEIIGETDCGEGGGCPYLGTAETYPPFYTHTAAAILRADPDGKVGGPGLANVRSPILPALLDHCSRQAVPLHFVSWHIYSNDPLAIRGTVEHARGVLARYPSLQVETILDEWSVMLGVNTTGADPRFLCCFIPETIWQMKEAGLDLSCYYQIRDYHVDESEFARFFTPGGAAFMARWWNRMPQAGGLFDFQNTVRPAYFSFKLLSRLSGDRIAVESSDSCVHAFATHDAHFNMRTVMLWNFSDTPRTVRVRLDNVPEDGRLVPFVLDPVSPSQDENHRIRMAEESPLSAGSSAHDLEVAPWGVHQWYIHGTSWSIGH